MCIRDRFISFKAFITSVLVVFVPTYSFIFLTISSMYETKGNPHKDEIVKKINEYVGTDVYKRQIIRIP